MILSLSSLFSFVLHSLFLYLNGYKVYHNTIRTKNKKHTWKDLKQKNNFSHKPNVIRTIKAKNRILLEVKRRTSECGESDVYVCGGKLG